MTESFLQLPRIRQLEALKAIEISSGGTVSVLTKDIWAVRAVGELFSAPFGAHLVFKGGTSLSKGYQAIQGFSEDIDLSYNIKKLIPERIGDMEDAIPPGRSRSRRWTEAVWDSLAERVSNCIVPLLVNAIGRDGLCAEVRIGGERNEKILSIMNPCRPGITISALRSYRRSVDGRQESPASAGASSAMPPST